MSTFSISVSCKTRVQTEKGGALNQIRRQTVVEREVGAERTRMEFRSVRPTRCW